MTLAILDREAVESVAESGCENDPRFKLLTEAECASRRVRSIREALRELQTVHNNELRALWDSLVPTPRKFLALRAQVAREIEIAESWVDPANRFEERAKIEARHSDACSKAWSRHTRRYHVRAKGAMREKLAEQQVAEGEITSELNVALDEERKAWECLERFLKKVD